MHFWGLIALHLLVQFNNYSRLLRIRVHYLVSCHHLVISVPAKNYGNSVCIHSFSKLPAFTLYPLRGGQHSSLGAGSPLPMPQHFEGRIAGNLLVLDKGGEMWGKYSNIILYS